MIEAIVHLIEEGTAMPFVASTKVTPIEKS
jgi:hypothetical protein